MEGNADEIADRTSRRGETRCWGDLSLSAPPIVATLPRIRRTILGMSRIHPECPESGSSELSAVANVLLREEPDEEEDEEEEDEEEDKGDGKEDDGDDETDDGYSE
jgi:hypothetical protein